MAGYTYDNDSEFASAHHAALSVMLDGFTQQRIRELLPLVGRQCLDVGAGGGSICRWLAEEVWPDGAVTATDINTGRLSSWPGVRVVEHDITVGPVPDVGAGFDLVHARLLLNHLPGRDAALRHMVQGLKPGGVLLTQDFLPMEPGDLVIKAPTDEAADLLELFQRYHLRILRENGNDRQWSLRAAGVLEDQGMVDVREVAYDTGEWHGQGPGCLLLLAGLHQIKDRLMDAGFDVARLHRVGELLESPEVVLRGYQFYSVSGRRPGAT